MDVLDACVMHSSLTAGFGVQGTFKYRTENRRGYFAPVEGSAVVHDDIHDFFVEIRNLNVLVGEKPAVHVGKRRKLGVVLVTIFGLGVESLEQVDEPATDILNLETLYVFLKCSLCIEQPRIFCI